MRCCSSNTYLLNRHISVAGAPHYTIWRACACIQRHQIKYLSRAGGGLYRKPVLGFIFNIGFRKTGV